MTVSPLPSTPWVGVNFWSRAGGPRMWTERYSPAVVREELDVLAAHGCAVTRSFCFWPDFVPAPEQLDEAVMGRFADFLDAHAERGMTTIPTFLVGHMSGENWDPAWRGGRDLYRDVWFVGQQAWFVAAVAERFRTSPAITGWLLTNEVPIYGGAAPDEDVAAWARLLLAALRSTGATQPASIGDGAWGIEVTGVDNGFSVRRLAPMVDFLGPHVYPMSDDQVRQHSAAAFACLMSGTFDRPVVLEEFGLSSDFAAADHAAAYYRQVLHSSLVAGARGWLAWNNTDYDDLAAEDPYRHHPFEMHFGLTDHRGQPKPALRELARFSERVAALGLRADTPVTAPQVRLVVPEHLERSVPFTNERERTEARDALFQAYVTTREADLVAGVSREADGLAEGVRLWLLPSTKQLTAPTSLELARRVEAGAVAWLSYFPGTQPIQRGPWVYRLEELWGVRQRLRYGLADHPGPGPLELRFARDFGSIGAGTVLAFDPVAAGQVHLPVEPAGAEVVATDAAGRPALLAHRVGDGWAVLCTYPLEHLAAVTPAANPEPTWRIYDALADLAGVDRPLRCPDGRVSCAVLDLGESRVGLVANLSGERLRAPVDAPGWTDGQPVDLGPHDVAVLTPGGTAAHR